MNRASETSRSILKHYRSFLCAAAVAAFAVCLTPSASATTYNPSSVNCQSGGNYQAPTADPVNPTPSNVAELDANQDGSGGPWTVQCTWSGYPDHISSGQYVHINGGFGCAPKGAQGAANITVFSGTTSLGGWHEACRDASSVGLTLLVTSGINLNTISVVVRDVIDAGSGGDDNSGLTISTLSIY